MFIWLLTLYFKPVAKTTTPKYRTYISDVDEGSPLLRGSMRRGGGPLRMWAFLLQHTKQGKVSTRTSHTNHVHARLRKEEMLCATVALFTAFPLIARLAR